MTHDKDVLAAAEWRFITITSKAYQNIAKNVYKMNQAQINDGIQSGLLIENMLDIAGAKHSTPSDEVLEAYKEMLKKWEAEQ